MNANQTTLNQDFSLRRSGWPWVLTDEEIKEHKNEQIRKYLINRKQSRIILQSPPQLVNQGYILRKR